MTEKLTTFFVGDNLYGIEVLKVQEVTGAAKVVRVPLAPSFVRGLINLRGQIATALGLRQLFKLSQVDNNDEMSVVCRLDGHLISFLVDSIGDVVEVDLKTFERPPDTISSDVRPFIKGIYKTKDNLLSVLDVERLSKEITQSK